MALMEGLIRHVFSRVLKVAAAGPVPAPHLRRGDAPLRLRQAGPARAARTRRRRGSRARVASSRCSRRPAADPDGRVAALRVPRGGELTRKQIDDYTAFVGRHGARGPRLYKGERRGQGPRRPAVADPEVPVRMRRSRASSSARRPRPATSIFFGADKAKVVNDALGALRLQLGRDLGLVEEGWQPLWVVDFPMFEWDPDAKRWMAMHHPFTSPADPGSGGARRRTRRTRLPAPTTWC